MRKIIISKVILKSQLFPLKAATGVFAEVPEFAIAQISKPSWKILKLPDYQSRFVLTDNIHNSRDGGNRTGGIEPEEERARQRDREQLELYKQKEHEQKHRAQEQMEIGRKNEDKQKKRSRPLENIIFFCRICDRRRTNLLGQLDPNQRYTD